MEGGEKQLNLPQHDYVVRTHSQLLCQPSLRGVLAAVVIAPGPSGQPNRTPVLSVLRPGSASRGLATASCARVGLCRCGSYSAPKINFRSSDSHAACRHFLLTHARAFSSFLFICFEFKSQGYTYLLGVHYQRLWLLKALVLKIVRQTVRNNKGINYKNNVVKEFQWHRSGFTLL